MFMNKMTFIVGDAHPTMHHICSIPVFGPQGCPHAGRPAVTISCDGMGPGHPGPQRGLQSVPAEQSDSGAQSAARRPWAAGQGFQLGLHRARRGQGAEHRPRKVVTKRCVTRSGPARHKKLLFMWSNFVQGRAAFPISHWGTGP